MNFMFHTMLDAACNILRMHYRSMKCDVSFSLGSVSTLFRWGGHFCHTCVKHFFLLTTVQKILKLIEIFQSYDHKCTATFLWFTVYLYNVAVVFCSSVYYVYVTTYSLRRVPCTTYGFIMYCIVL